MIASNAEVRARQSRGTSHDAILGMVRRALESRKITGECLLDVGCGAGNLYRCVASSFRRYIGVDVVQYAGFPEESQFCKCDLDGQRIPLPDESADVVAAVEVIEHLENPRLFMRNLVRLAKPDGWVIVTTPNQLSLLSLANLIVRKRFLAFQDVHYPTHLTALLEVDLRRIAAECGLSNIEIQYSLSARLPLCNVHYPRALSRLFPRALSENVLVIGQRSSAA
jgi:2-polyprenyl-3-methyl-5-hydroxy-6-metoxy-1,4-benzoquinol methylase